MTYLNRIIIRICPKLLLLLSLIGGDYAFSADKTEEYTGPYRGKVIDAETKVPLEGAVVLAVWEKVYRTPAGPNTQFYDAKEVLTDPNGYFEIPPYNPKSLNPLTSFRGPLFTIFKPSYGHFPNHQVSPRNNLMKAFRKEITTVELKKWKTKEDRQKNLPGIDDPFPNNEYKKFFYIKSLNIERRLLGLKPYSEPGGEK